MAQATLAVTLRFKEYQLKEDKESKEHSCVSKGLGRTLLHRFHERFNRLVYKDVNQGVNKRVRSTHRFIW